MIGLEIGQVISAKIRFNNSGLTSSVNHPYLVIGIHKDLGTVEIAQIDSLAGKEYKAAMKCNKVVYCDEPVESVIDKDSYVQLDNTFQVEWYEGLCNYRRQTDKLSAKKLAELIQAYRDYHSSHHIDENKQVYMTKKEFEALQKSDTCKN